MAICTILKRKESKMKKGVILSLLFTAAFLSLSLLNVSAPAILVTPIGQTINVTSNGNFVLAYKMIWNEPDPGYFSATFYWDSANTTPYWNFTYVGFVCRFTDSTEFSTPIDVAIKKGVPHGYPSGHYRYTVTISESYGESHNGEFWLNVTMRAAGVADDVHHPHSGGNRSITISKVRCYEKTTTEAGPGIITIHVNSRILSCDSTGAPKEAFNATLGESVYVRGYGFQNSTTGATIRLYVVPNQTWTDGRAIEGDVRGDGNTTSVTGTGILEPIRLGKLDLGAYDIVADANNNSVYDVATDALDDITSYHGVIVIPEFSSWIAIAIAALTIIPIVICIRNRRLNPLS